MMYKRIFSLLRISHWSKSLFVLLGVLYAQTPGYIGSALLAAFSFCLIASAVYVYNDVQDLEEDKVHPHKAKRPLARGDVSLSLAWKVFVFCIVFGFLIAFMVSKPVVLLLVIYLFINLLYNHWLRRILFCDVMCIACGFMLRILAGTWGIGLPITWWLTITATLLSLFIALCKRRLELHLGTNHTQRAVLKKYSPHLLDVLIASTASSCFIAYLLYAVYGRAETVYFLWTLPFSAIGLWRFAFLTTQPNKTDDPVTVFLNDNMSRLNLLFFFSLTIMALF